ncbi:Glycosyl hydrolases family 2 [Massilia sp. PDC64]|nr:glycoside hydrolase family 2 TIM barrel-domain containing protein [Massilia sp. PDC64]SDE95214.1 Glycosyl hydrolases family 2 [Massilia sp. PDC64]
MRSQAATLTRAALIRLAARAAVALAMLTGTTHPVAATEQPAARQRQNFNAGWRFHLGDIGGAEKVDFDDADWQAVGLPHSFSTPYFQAPEVYVGYGWYRKDLVLPAVPAGRRWTLEFEAAFQTAEVYVNGRKVARHRGGYTGFPVDLTSALHAGRNVIAVRVDNIWDPTLAPRAGEHIFSGGIYRDVWLVTTDDVHVPWTGTAVTTPGLSGRSGAVRVATEVRNDGRKPVKVRVRTRIADARGATVAVLPDAAVQVPPGRTLDVAQQSRRLSGLKLWSPESPTLYRAVTTLDVAGRQRDRFETPFGFRTIEWTADRGFFLNGEHRYFRGANVHQDQAGWGDAVTNAAIERDVQLMKDAGFDFIRGSHYPHDPHFAEATDRIGMLFLPEAPFWGTAGMKSPWSRSAYPPEPEHQAAFEESVKQQLAELIRINRNHPSVVAWGMDNEVFFTDKETLPAVRKLLADEVALSHQLDPTRPAAVDGAQRGDIDRIGDIAGYNGDGAVLFPNPGIPNFVAEYGSTISDRPGEYDPGWGDIERTPGEKAGEPATWRFPWRAGEAVWAGFDHGSIAGKFGSMGLVDYARLPKRSWYWYRNAYRGIAPPAWPKPGKPAALRVTASRPVILHADGTDDVQLVVTVVDAAGNPLSDSPPVRLALEAGPGELPTGRTISFTPDGDIPIRDGQAAIAMRSWQRGTTRIRATSPGLADGVLTVKTADGPRFVAGRTPLAADRPYVTRKMEVGAEQAFGLKNPTQASSSAAGHAPSLANDGDAATWWAPAADDAAPWIVIDPERIVNYRRLAVTFAPGGRCGVTAEAQDAGGVWQTLAEAPATADTLEVPVRAVTGRRLRLRLAGGTCRIADVVIMGTPATFW